MEQSYFVYVFLATWQSQRWQHNVVATEESITQCVIVLSVKPKSLLSHSLLTLLLVSRAGSCGLMQAWAILMTCSSFLGCSSTLAARNNVVWEIIWRGGEKKTSSEFFIARSTSNYGISQHCSGTYISMEFGEGVNHIKPVHIYYSSVDN